MSTSKQRHRREQIKEAQYQTTELQSLRQRNTTDKMGKSVLRRLIMALLLQIIGASAATNCSTSVTFQNSVKHFSNCVDLSVQKASVAWTLHNLTLDIIFSGTALSSSGWVGWGINLGPSPAMIGTQAFIAFQAPNGSTILTYNVTSDTKQGLPLRSSPISLHVLDKQVQISGTSIAIFVSLQLRRNQSTVLNHVWNRGVSVTNFQPGAHGFTPADLSGLKVINMSSGISSTTVIELPHQILKNRHAILNTVGWGVLLPIGVMAARYLRPLTDPGWFYTHVSLQIAGYSLGVAGWGIGLKLGSYSVGIVYRKHRFIGIALFTIATLQVMALLLRPKKDHKYRFAWNWYHYTLGISILTLGILNIFYGFDILLPPAKWRNAYIGVIASLGIITVILEIVSWMCCPRSAESSRSKLHGATVGGPEGQRRV